ncbi:MAG TPA: helix-turn-helix transcriptional regulator [Streptosporangiaceae bacterium]
MDAAEAGRLIRKARQIAGWKQRELADRIGVDRSAVSQWERGEHYPVRYEGKIEHVLGISFGAEPELPKIVADNSDLDQVLTIWNAPGFSRAERIHLIRGWLSRRHPERLPAPAGEADGEA